jgi:GH25 family lysozyme M1 (1,4-beta-N-acetylmuramidase)
MRRIIDVSHDQGFIHWHLVKEQVDAVGFKAADGMYEDNGKYAGIPGYYSYTENRLRADRYNVPVEFVYGWWYPSRPDQTTAQMTRALWNLASGVRLMGDLELGKGVVWNPKWKLDIRDYLDALDQLDGRPAVAYLGIVMLNNLSGPGNSYPDWLLKPGGIQRPLAWAQYPKRFPLKDQWNMKEYAFALPNNIPAGITPWLWQFSENGVLTGISGNSVDLNYEVTPLQ